MALFDIIMSEQYENHMKDLGSATISIEKLEAAVKTLNLNFSAEHLRNDDNSKYWDFLRNLQPVLNKPEKFLKLADQEKKRFALVSKTVQYIANKHATKLLSTEKSPFHELGIFVDRDDGHLKEACDDASDISDDTLAMLKEICVDDEEDLQTHDLDLDDKPSKSARDVSANEEDENAHDFFRHLLLPTNKTSSSVSKHDKENQCDIYDFNMLKRILEHLVNSLSIKLISPELRQLMPEVPQKESISPIRRDSDRDFQLVLPSYIKDGNASSQKQHDIVLINLSACWNSNTGNSSKKYQYHALTTLNTVPAYGNVDRSPDKQQATGELEENEGQKSLELCVVPMHKGLTQRTENVTKAKTSVKQLYNFPQFDFSGAIYMYFPWSSTRMMKYIHMRNASQEITSVCAIHRPDVSKIITAVYDLSLIGA
jgi:hypothetical protein